MATAIHAPYSTEIKLGPAPQNFALKYVAGKNLGDSLFPPYLPRVLFTTIDSRKIFLEAEEASEFERALLALGVQPGDFVSAARVKMPRGGGSAIRVQRVVDPDDLPAPPSRIEAQLEKSVEMARTAGPAAFITPPERHPVTAVTTKLCATMCVLIDSMAEAKTYAQRRGIDLTNEDLRCLVTTAFINDCKGGAR